MWYFQEFQNSNGSCPVSDWCTSLSPKNQSKFEKFLGIVRELKQLRRPHFRKFRKLSEARWSGENNVPHRIFCYFPLRRKTVTFLCGCTHKGNQYDPPSAYETAATRRKKIVRGQACESKFDI